MLQNAGVEVFSSDLILNGIIIQKLEFDRSVSASSRLLGKYFCSSDVLPSSADTNFL